MRAVELSHNGDETVGGTIINRVCPVEFIIESQMDTFRYAKSKVIFNAPGEKLVNWTKGLTFLLYSLVSSVN